MQQYYPVYNRQIEKNKPASASLVLSIISLVLLVLILPFIFAGGMLISMAGQSPEASGYDSDDKTAMEEYDRESGILGIIGIVLIFAPPVLSGMTAIPGLVFGILGARSPNKRGHAVAGIVMSSIPLCIGLVYLLFVFF